MAQRYFDSICKKLAIPLFVFFEVGWIIFTARFALVLANKDESTDLKESSDRESPLYFPYYFTLVGGQFVALSDSSMLYYHPAG